MNIFLILMAISSSAYIILIIESIKHPQDCFLFIFHDTNYNDIMKKLGNKPCTRVRNLLNLPSNYNCNETCLQIKVFGRFGMFISPLDDQLKIGKRLLQN